MPILLGTYCLPACNIYYKAGFFVFQQGLEIVLFFVSNSVQLNWTLDPLTGSRSGYEEG